MSEPPVERRAVNHELERSVTALNASIGELRGELRTDLVRKDVYQIAQQRTDDRIIAAIEGNKATLALVKEIEERRGADRRLVITALVMPIVLIVLQLYLASQVGR